MAVDYFLKIAEVPGGSTHAAHKDEIDLESWRWGETRTTAGGLAVQDLDFSAPMSKASPKLFEACATGVNFKEAILTGRQAGEAADFVRWTLKDVLVSSYRSGGTASSSRGVDRVTLDFVAIELEGSGTPNRAPTVNAGADQTIALPTPAPLAGQASDDGLPVGGSLTTTWSKVSGPGTVTFANPNARSTTATFSQPGAYVLRFTASDAVLAASDDVTIMVNPAVPPPNVCNPRPNVGVFVRQVGAGRLEVTIRAQTNVNTPSNALQGVRVNVVTNAVIDIPNGPAGLPGNTSVPLRNNNQESVFEVRRLATGPFRADLVVADRCGDWETFVGGGINVP